jgi:hypothetical protein
MDWRSFELEILEDFQFEGMFRFGANNPIELDLYLPNEKLAFEYQGEQHYHDIFTIGRGWNQKERDEEKKLKCKEKNIVLIDIPYWWDRNKESLMATIHKYRPDLVPMAKDTLPISHEPQGVSVHGTIVHNFQHCRPYSTNDAWISVERVPRFIRVVILNSFLVMLRGG